MKTRMILFLLSFVFTGNIFAQEDPKVGYVDFNAVLEAMPEMDSASVVYDEIVNEDASYFMEKYLLGVIEGYISGDSEEEKALRAELESIRRDVEADARKRREAFFEPIKEKVREALADVAKEYNYVYIYDSVTAKPHYDALPEVEYIFQDEEQIEDITELIMDKLANK